MHWTKKLKGPQMRMHADEEEKKINKKRKIAARLGGGVSHRTTTKLVESTRGEDLRARISQANAGSVWSRLQRPPSAKERRRGYLSDEVESEEEERPRHRLQSTISAVKGDLRGAISVKKSKSSKHFFFF
jgi:hypothetical protein